MAQDKFETKLERFVIDYYEEIGIVNAVGFLVGMAVILIIGNAPILIAFTAFMIGCSIVAMVLVGRPDRKRMKAWRINKKNVGRNPADESSIRSDQQVRSFPERLRVFLTSPTISPPNNSHRY